METILFCKTIARWRAGMVSQLMSISWSNFNHMFLTIYLREGFFLREFRFPRHKYLWKEMSNICLDYPTNVLFGKCQIFALIILVMCSLVFIFIIDVFALHIRRG